MISLYNTQSSMNKKPIFKGQNYLAYFHCTFNFGLPVHIFLNEVLYITNKSVQGSIKIFVISSLFLYLKTESNIDSKFFELNYLTIYTIPEPFLKLIEG